MLKAFFGAIFVCLVLFGTLSLCYVLMFRSLMPKKRYDYYIVIPSDNCEKELTSAVYSAKTKLDLMGDSDFAKVIVLDRGMDEHQRLSCLNICRQTNGVYLMDSDQIRTLFK